MKAVSDNTHEKLSFDLNFDGNISYEDVFCRWQWCWWNGYVVYMIVTDLRCCWQNHYVGNFFSLCWWFCKCIKLTDLNLSPTNFFSNIRHQHRFQPKIPLREVFIRDRREPSGRSRLFPKIMFPVLKKIPAETFPRRFPASWFPLISGVIFQQVIWLGMAVPLILISILRWWVRLMYFSNLII